jgi:hypothetical protein
MALDVNNAESIWTSAKQPLLKFILHTFHHDINVIGTSLYQARHLSDIDGRAGSAVL